MRLDIDFIKKILNVMEENNSSYTMLGNLLEALSIETSNDEKLDTLAGHIRLMRDSGFVNCIGKDCGFMATLNSTVGAINTGSRYEITLQGYQMLDAMRNDNLMGKIKGYLSEVGISGIKKAPGYIIGIATEYMTKS